MEEFKIKKEGENESGLHVIEARVEAAHVAGKRHEAVERLTSLTEVHQAWCPGGERETGGTTAGDRR